jgi:hypothetical protein
MRVSSCRVSRDCVDRTLLDPGWLQSSDNSRPATGGALCLHSEEPPSTLTSTEPGPRLGGRREARSDHRSGRGPSAWPVGRARIRATYRAAARRVRRCHGMDLDEAQQPPPTCWLPHLATATRCRRGAQVFGEKDLLSRIVFHMKGARRDEWGCLTRLDLLVDVGRYRRRVCRSGPTWARTGIGGGRRNAR